MVFLYSFVKIETVERRATHHPANLSNYACFSRQSLMQTASLAKMHLDTLAVGTFQSRS
jgi:hypothetical protein